METPKNGYYDDNTVMRSENALMGMLKSVSFMHFYIKSRQAKGTELSPQILISRVSSRQIQKDVRVLDFNS